MLSSKNTKPKNNNNQMLRSKAEGKVSDFNFLIKSIERQKFAHQIQKENQQSNQGRYSIKVKPSFLEKPTMVNSITVRPFQAGKQRQPGNPHILQRLTIKIKKYLTITQPMLQTGVVEDKLRKQGINTACELIQMMTSNEKSASCKDESPFASLNNTATIKIGHNKGLSSSFIVSNGLGSSLADNGEPVSDFVRKIENLEQEKLYLEDLISKHERTNIKMFIKLNEGQSQQIEQCKKQLASLFQKYKQLQKLVRRQSEKSKSLQQKLDQCKNQTGCSKLCETNTNQLKKRISQLEQQLNQRDQSLSLAIKQIQRLKIKLQSKQLFSKEYSQPQEAKKSKNWSKISEAPHTDLSKSVYSDIVNEQISNKSHSNCRSINAETHRYFSNVSILSANDQPGDQNILRMLLVQANVLEAVLKDSQNE